MIWPFGGSEEKADPKILKLHAVEIGLFTKLGEVERQMEAEENTAGDAVLSGAFAGDGNEAAMAAGRRMAILREKAGALVAGMRRAREERVALFPIRNRELAAASRAKAAELLKEADAIEEKTLPLRKQLAELTGVDWVPGNREHVTGERFPMGATGVQGGAPAIVRVFRANYAVLRGQAAELERAAAQQETASVTMHGHAIADSVEQLIADLQRDPLRITPRWDLVRSWAMAEAAKDRLKPVPKGVHGRRQIYVLEFDIAWKNGVLQGDHCIARRKYLQDEAGAELFEEEMPPAA